MRAWLYSTCQDGPPCRWCDDDEPLTSVVDVDHNESRDPRNVDERAELYPVPIGHPETEAEAREALYGNEWGAA